MAFRVKSSGPGDAVAQFDAYPNPTASQREAFPYFVVMQSDQLAQFGTRLVMPLARLQTRPRDVPRRLSQAVEVLGEMLYPVPHLLAALPLRVLSQPVASLRAQGPVFVDALDAVVSGV